MAISLFIFSLGLGLARGAEEYSDSFRLAGQMTKFGLYGLTLVMLAMAPLRHKRNAYLASFWLLWSYIQWARWLPVLDLSYPVYYHDFYGNVAETFCPISLDTSQGRAIDQHSFTLYCAHRSLFVLNGVDMLILLAATLGLMLAAVFLGAGTHEGILASLKTEAKYSLLFRGVSMTSQDLTIYAIIQMQYADFGDALSIFSIALAGLCLILQVIYLVYVPMLIHRSHGLVCAGLPPSFCSTLVDDFRPGLRRYAYHYESIQQIKRLAGALVLVLLWRFARVQVALLAALEGGVGGYVLLARPFNRGLETVLTCYMHVAVLCLLAIQSLYWTSISPTSLCIASILTFWSGLIAAMLRYFLTFKQTSATAHLAPSPQQDTGDSLVITQVKSQLPNEPYHSALVSTVGSRM